MDSSDSDPESPTSKSRRYGLSDWMERLNTATDFEQYACSPPDTGFLSDYAAGMDCPCNVTTETVTDHATPNHMHMLKEDQKFQWDKLNTRPELESPVSPKSRSPSSPKPLPILDALKCEEIIYSSPDTTPCVTPQASPIPRRKISGVPEETVQSNPKKWFFLGYTREEDKLRLMKGQCSKHPKTIKQSESHREKFDERSKSKPKVTGDNADFKLELSNFDMNAISPTSW